MRKEHWPIAFAKDPYIVSYQNILIHLWSPSLTMHNQLKSF
ncbi:hypothetical protein APA_626 [Pseudanabaena sp. lw0831]|nr:hypothetical protein APA_626 [Pseudanabaena sp. lw0831]